MEKQRTNQSSAGKALDCEDLKVEPQMSATLGEMLLVDSTPEQEKKVVRKLDMMYVDCRYNHMYLLNKSAE